MSGNMNQFPLFNYRQTYQTELNTLEEVIEQLFNFKFKDGFCFTGMGKYEYICISTFYSYYLSLYPDIEWHDVELDFGKIVYLSIVMESIVK